MHEKGEKPLDDASFVGDAEIASANTLTCVIVEDPMLPLVYSSDSDLLALIFS